MLYNHLLIPIILFAPSLVSAALPIGQIVAANEAFTQNTNEADTDVNKPSILNDQIPKDFEDIISIYNGVVAQGAGTPAATDEGTEESITDSYHTVCEATTQLMNDLVSKKTIYIAALQGDAIYNSLKDYFNAFWSYQNFQASIVADQDHKDDVFEDAEGALQAILDAESEYEPAGVEEKRGFGFKG